MGFSFKSLHMFLCNPGLLECRIWLQSLGVLYNLSILSQHFKADVFASYETPCFILLHCRKAVWKKKSSYFCIAAKQSGKKNQALLHMVGRGLNPGSRHMLSQVASMLYVDSPAGVGLSYSETKEDYDTNDTQTAHDLNVFLRTFFYKYEEFSKLDFYITGKQGQDQFLHGA
jgi:hypothetical protein